METPCYTFELVTPPAAEPVTVDELKSHVRETADDEDLLIAGYIGAARRHLEDVLGRQLVTATWRLHLDGFPACGHDIEIRKSPVAAVTGITYYDTAGDQQTWDSADYEADLAGEPARVRPAYGVTYPATRCGQLHAVTVTFTAGSAAGGVDPRARVAILLLAGHWYEHREAVGRAGLAPLPLAVESLVDSLRWTVPV